MNAPLAAPRCEALRIAGEKVATERSFEVRFPYTGEVVATVPKATVDDVRRAIATARAFRARLTRYERYRILMRAGEIIASRRDDIARTITLESGLCLKDTLYEVGRASDVLLFAANQALVDDGQVFSCDLTPHGKSRKVYTLREPLQGVITAITPFNHPLNQVIHKVAPAVATNNRVVLKPSEKTPLAAYLLADILYEAGLPPPMLSVVTGDPHEIADELLTHADVDLVTFTGGVAVGKTIAAKAVYKRQVLELGGNDPIIVMDDADVEEAATLAASGSYKNSGQRCTAVKRMLVHRAVADEFVERLVAKTRAVQVRRSARRGDRHGHRNRRGGSGGIRAPRQRCRAVGCAPAGRQRATRGSVFAHGARPGAAGHAACEGGNLRPGLPGHPFWFARRSDRHCELDRVRPVVFGLHQPAGRHHALHRGAERRDRQRA